ncbi:MAG: ABC transporter substrate-binding protein [Clostridia bacterium]|nr:ABC transporter substrate-binding protein [Clostridia bacterium]MBT7122849.1 ABC transporter substrate-binding protein [Clostridia bacterium]
MRKAILVLVCIMMAVSFTACGARVEEPKNGEQMRTVVDCVGRQVRIVQNVDRIAATYSPAGHITVMLGHGEDIVATSNGLQRDKMLHEICPEIKNASVVKVSGDFNIEELVSLDVDVVFVSHDMYLDEKAMRKLDEVGLPYVVVSFDSIEEQKTLVRVIADVLNEETEAQVYIDFYDKVLDMVSALHEERNESDVTVYHSINEAVNTVGRNTLPQDWMKAAGGIDVSLGGQLAIDEDKYYTTLEQILMWDPQVILCNVDTTYEYINEQAAWQNMQAVKNGDVYLMPVGISRWGHTTSIETPLAIVWTAKTLYPDTFGDVNLEELMREFYSELFEYEVTDEQIVQILRGEGMRYSKNLE